MKWSGFSDGEIARFETSQRLSFEVQAAIAQSLRTGMTEREVAKAMFLAYREAGVQSYFHLPVALFGERTTLPDPWAIGEFWPSEKVLEPGDAVILDASPIFGGTLVDTSTTICHEGGGTDFARAAEDDLAYRDLVLSAVRSGATFQEIAIDVEKRFESAGYRNCHRMHPGEVLGHRVGDVTGSAQADKLGFASEVVDWFYSQLDSSVPTGEPAPTWSAGIGSNHAPADGLWAVEPHLGTGKIGVKWEEVLVIQGSEVFWLQEDPPHAVAAA